MTDTAAPARELPGADPLASRRVALAALDAVLRGERPLEDAVVQAEGFAALAPRDRAFVRLLLATAIRRIGEIDAAVGACLDRALPERATAAIDALRLGAAQLLFLGTQPHAAVDTSVRLVEAGGHPRFKGLVNAVLRRIARDGAALLGDRDPARLNTPGWLWDSWVGAYGEATARAIAAAHLVEAPLDFTVPRDAALWAGTLGAEILPTGTLRRAAGGTIESLPGYAEGAWWIQDAGAALAVRLLGDVAGKDAIDLCAAPGGKTLQLCAAGARVVAVDVSARRLRRVADNLARAGLAAELVAADAGVWRPKAPVQAVLLDAPCSATGTLRRHPDIAWLKGPEDVERLAMVQDRLLAAAADMVAPGGTVLYAVCSLQPEEGAARIDAALRRGVKLARDPARPEELPGLEAAVTPQGDVRTLPSMWPERGGLDGFFMARLRRTA